MSHDNGKQALNVKNVNIHFSYDDVWQCLDDITVHENEYNSLFENSFFAYLREKHKNMEVSLHSMFMRKMTNSE